jgi:monofunctional biosynthetic peptidoglycan transglycosylase
MRLRRACAWRFARPETVCASASVSWGLDYAQKFSSYMSIGQKHNRFRCLVRLVWIAGLGLLILPTLLILPLRWFPPPTSAFMLQWCFSAWRQGQGCHIHYQWIDASEMASHMALAVVAAEDQKFPHHWGFDFDALVAVWQQRQDGGRASKSANLP